jgi:putative ABC transport system ATP-binding protein
MLILDNIKVTFAQHTKNERAVLNQLSLNVKAGEFVVIIGENGAGKSTLMNVITGQRQVNCGSIWIDGKNVTNTPQLSRCQLVSTVMQDPKIGTCEDMTIFENMALAFKRGDKRRFHLLSNDSRKKNFKEHLSILHNGLDKRMDDLVMNLSGGQRQSLSIVMAILRESKVLLLDEITAALDPISTQSVMNMTNAIIRSKKLTCLMITHDMEHALMCGDRLLLLKNGHFIKEFNQMDKNTMTPSKLAQEFKKH